MHVRLHNRHCLILHIPQASEAEPLRPLHPHPGASLQKTRHDSPYTCIHNGHGPMLPRQKGTAACLATNWSSSCLSGPVTCSARWTVFACTSPGCYEQPCTMVQACSAGHVTGGGQNANSYNGPGSSLLACSALTMEQRCSRAQCRPLLLQLLLTHS
jgi:hypothetical protein